MSETLRWTWPMSTRGSMLTRADDSEPPLCCLVLAGREHLRPPALHSQPLGPPRRRCVQRTERKQAQADEKRLDPGGHGSPPFGGRETWRTRVPKRGSHLLSSDGHRLTMSSAEVKIGVGAGETR